MAANNSWACHLVIHGDKERFYKENGNAKLIRATNAKLTFVEPQEISDTMDRAIEEFKDKGYNPFYLYGGGHSVQGALAYATAVTELKERWGQEGWYPDHIFLPSGTGSTQAGIIYGLLKNNLEDISVTGISIARQKERGLEVIKSLLNEMNESEGTKYNFNSHINFNPDYLMGGYEESSQKLNEFVRELNKETGIIFDTTYSGKAFYGMTKLVEQKELKGNILFWHTGGIFNYLAKQ